MNILHVITGLRAAAGTSVFVCELAREQVAAGHVVTIAIRETWRTDNYPMDPRIRLVGEGVVFQNSERFDVAHFHGLWEPMLHRVAQEVFARGIPVLWSPHGALAPWALKHKRWKKLPVWWLWQRRDLRRAAAFHATAAAEREWVRSCGIKHPIFEIPLGVRLPSALVGGEVSRSKTILFVGRIYPVKGLENLISAWGLLSHAAKVGWKLRIVGPNQAGYQETLQRQAQDLGVMGEIEFPGPKFGEELAAEYDRAGIFVLPSFSENFGSAVVEALAHGVPVVASRLTPWQVLEERKCGWWVDNAPQVLADALSSVMSLSDAERLEMGLRGRALCEERFSWSVVAKNIEDSYQKMILR